MYISLLKRNPTTFAFEQNIVMDTFHLFMVKKILFVLELLPIIS